MDSEYPACSQQMEIFDRVFPDGMELTYDNFELAKNEGLMLGWFIPHKMPYKLYDMIIKIMETSMLFMKEATYLIFDAEAIEMEKLKKSLSDENDVEKYNAKCDLVIEKYKIKRAKIREAYFDTMYYVSFEMLVAYGNDDGSIKEFEERIIARSDLVTNKPYACAKQLEKFEKYFPNGFIINEDNLKLANKLDFDIEWFISWKLEPKQISAIYQYYHMLLDQEDLLKDLYNRNRIFERTEQDEIFNASVRLTTSSDEKELRYNEHMDALDKIDEKYEAMLQELVNNRLNAQNLFALRMINAYGLLK